MKFKPNEVSMNFVYEKGKKVSELVKKHNADFGFNFSFFYNGIPLGDTFDGKNIISEKYGKMLKWNSFSFVNGNPVIGQMNINNKQDFLVQGSPLLIENGKLVYEQSIINDQTAPDITQSRCQRTAVGIDKEGNLIVVVCDGRTEENTGLSIKELSLFMQSKKCLFCLSGDGGGSSSLCTKDGMVNKQSEERVVSHAILIKEL